MGRVKTRLARDIGAVAATQFYRHNVGNILRRLGRDPRWTSWLSLSPDSAVTNRAFWPSNFQPFPQGGGDIGERMDRSLRTPPPGAVVVIGTDVPAIETHHIESAFKALGRHDAVFGPAEDGGYWLVGARRSPTTPDLFSGVRWSSPFTLSDTLVRLEKTSLKIALLDTLSDVDNGEDYFR